MSDVGYYEASYPPSIYDGGGSPPPVIADVSPASPSIGIEFQMSVHGTGFVDGCVIAVDGVDEADTLWHSSTWLNVQWTAVAVGDYEFTVRNPDGQVSNAFIVTGVDDFAAERPAPKGKRKT